MNRNIKSGNLVDNPKFYPSKTEDGKEVCTFRIATSVGQSQPIYTNVMCTRQANYMRNFSKGDKIFVDGKDMPNTSKDGKNSGLTLFADYVEGWKINNNESKSPRDSSDNDNNGDMPSWA